MADLIIEAGAIIDGYAIIRHLGTGGMADAWLAKDSVKRYCVLKILKQHLSKGPQRARFEREARVIASLNDSGVPGSDRIVKVHGVSPPESEVAYLVMEYVPGDDLQKKLTYAVPSRHEVLRFFREVLKGILAAHGRMLTDDEGKLQHASVIHRDIKPANILIDKRDNPKVSDFGLAGFDLLPDGDSVVEAPGDTRESVLAGTHGYMPPEQAELDLANVDERGDIYALGALLMKMLTGREPSKLLRLHLRAGQAVLLEGVEEPLRGIILKACRHDRDERYQTVAEFIAAIDPILADTPKTEPAWKPRPGVIQPAVTPHTPSPQPTTPKVNSIEAPRKQGDGRVANPFHTDVWEPPAWRKWVWWIGGGLAIAAIILVAIFLAWPKGGTETVENPPVVETPVETPVAPPPEPIPTPTETAKPPVETPPVTSAPIVANPKPAVPVKVEAPKPPIKPEPKAQVEKPPDPVPPPVETPAVTEPKITIVNPPAQAKVGDTIPIKVKVVLPPGSTVSRASLYWQGANGGAWQSKPVTVNEGTIVTSIPALAGLGKSVQFYVAVWVDGQRNESTRSTTEIVP